MFDIDQQKKHDPEIHNLVVQSIEITPGSPDAIRPKSFDEWQQQQRTSTVLSAWSNQMTHERQLRAQYAKWVFILVSVQVILTFALIAAQGYHVITLDNDLIKFLIPTEAAEILGLAYIVTRYLFNHSLRNGLDKLLGPGPV